MKGPEPRQPQQWATCLLVLGCLGLIGVPQQFQAAEAVSPRPSSDLTELTLEELMNLPVTSVTKSPRRMSESAAAIHVITQDDIRRSGVTSLPEALRMAPGVQVARVGSRDWAISARGFNDVFANKLLVLQDGRSIYTPLFSGTFWDAQDTLLEDIDRIEVIRGPGSTLWGANAVNGVINVITKSARETQGLLLTAGAGTEEVGFGGLRYGGALGNKAHYRAYVKYFSRDDSEIENDSDANDHWQMARSGFRVDWEPWESNLLTLQGDIYAGELQQTYTIATLGPPFQRQTDETDYVRGGNIVGRWSHVFSPESDVQVQFYYDRTERDSPIFGEVRDTFDLDGQHRWQWGERHDFIWGLGYRVTADEVDNTFAISLNPDRRSTQLFSAFLQDEIELVPERVKATVGSKFEHNDFTGFEWQPSARISWTPRPRHILWAAVSRSVRTPSRAEDDIRLNQQVFPPGTLGAGSPAAVTALFGTRDFASEELIAYEAGYRVVPHDRITVDLALFYNDYDRLRSLEARPPAEYYLEFSRPTPILVIPADADNQLYGETYGGEIAVNFQVITNRWRAQVAYSFLDLQLHRRPGSAAPETDEGRNPHHQLTLRSTIDLTRTVEFDWMVRYVDALPAIGISSYVAFDVRLGWRPRPNLELALVGQNLLDNRHPEFRPSFIATPAAEVEHSVYGKITWRY